MLSCSPYILVLTAAPGLLVFTGYISLIQQLRRVVWRDILRRMYVRTENSGKSYCWLVITELESQIVKNIIDNTFVLC